MSRTKWFRRRPERQRPRTPLQVEQLEPRNLLSTGLKLMDLVQVSDPSPLPAPASTTPTVFVNSEVEPQIAVDPQPGMSGHAVAVWQQDRYRSVGGARAIVVSVTHNASDQTPIWSPPAAIPFFNSTDATNNTIDPATGQGYARYTDPWVAIAPNGDVYAVALALTPVGPIPGHTAVLVTKSTDGGFTWSKPTMLIHNDAPAGTDPADLANDKEMVVADPNNAKDVYVVWDRLNHPSDLQNFNAFHGVPFREDMMFARTTDGGRSWNGGDSPPAVAGFPAADITNFQDNESAFGNEIVVQPDGTLVDVFTDGTGSGNQAVQADHNVLGIMRSTDHGATWSAVITGPAIETIGVTDPDTGAPVRSGEPLTSVAVDPNNGNLYAVWADARFSDKFSNDSIAFSMSTDGGLTWSDPIKVNQTPTTIPAGDQQAFTPIVAVNSDGTVAVSYYDFRNNDANPGLPTDYWLVHASSNFTDPTSWTMGELRLTVKSFNMENAAPTSRGLFLGDYEGLAAAGKSFYALFAQAGAGSSDPSNIFFRDPPPAVGGGDAAGAVDAGAPGSPVAAVGPQDSVGAPLVGGLNDALATVGADFGSAAARFLLSPADPATVPLSTGEGGTKALETTPSAPAAAGDDATALAAAPQSGARDLSTTDATDAASADPGDVLPQDPLANADDM
jgi:hypothetical protein